ncbi:MAG TPA: hypothetical protein VL326_35860 [Kofleriaceae bacterium]|jgi:hypothetical protein|nr:hypothetical protein [Kofleriaceae bacterium]
MRNWVLVLAAVASVALGCGDNSRSCGDGTIEMSGYCVPYNPDGSVSCGPGTVLDPGSGMCQVDPSVCQNGTVLIDTMCVDPLVGTVVDLQEGPEPNGLGVVEASGGRAGTLSLKGGEMPFVVHGTIDPFADNGSGGLLPDVDTYVLVITQPVLVRVTGAGLHGVNAGLVATSPDIAGWKRFALASGTASKRQLYLPKPGTYFLSVADTRTLFQYAETGTATAAPGGDNGDYFIAITKTATPSPTPLVAAASATLENGDVAFYSASITNGSHPITLAMPSTFAVGSLVVTADMFFAFDDEDSQPARIVASGLGASLIVVDHAYDVSPSPVAFQLTIQ